MKGLQLLAAQKNISLELARDEEVVVPGDRLKLQQVISNIIDNGIKYTPEGGRVTGGGIQHSLNTVLSR
jgi:signal transduction histidine kinase